MRWALCALWLLFAAPALASARPAEPTLAAELLALSNAARAEAGAAPLAPDARLAAAAREHSLEMAALGYFSHRSPRARSRTLGMRVARAGAAAQVLGENLALVAAEEAAARSVLGWLRSPGHRANLLAPRFNRVGFGVAASAGRVYVTQVLAYEPAPLLRAEAAVVRAERLEVKTTVNVSEAAELALFYGDASTPAQTFQAGTHTLSFDLEADAFAAQPRLHLRLGARPPGAEGAFTLQDDGWLSESAWQPSGSGPHELGHFVSAVARRQTKRVLEARLEFARAPTTPLGAWWGETFLAPGLTPGLTPERRGALVTVRLPSGPGAPVLRVGERQPDGSYTLLYRFRLAPGSAQLVPEAAHGAGDRSARAR